MRCYDTGCSWLIVSDTQRDLLQKYLRRTPAITEPDMTNLMKQSAIGTSLVGMSRMTILVVPGSLLQAV